MSYFLYEGQNGIPSSKSKERTMHLSTICFIICRFLNRVKIRGYFYSKYKIDKLLDLNHMYTLNGSNSYKNVNKHIIWESSQKYANDLLVSKNRKVNLHPLDNWSLKHNGGSTSMLLKCLPSKWKLIVSIQYMIHKVKGCTSEEINVHQKYKDKRWRKHSNCTP